MRWIPVIQSSKHDRYALDGNKCFDATNYTSPGRVAPCQAFGSEKRRVEQKLSHDRSKYAVNLIVWFKTLSKILKERLDFCWNQYVIRGGRA